MSVTEDTGSGWASFATTNNSLLLLYNPTVVIYGEKYEPVTLSFNFPFPGWGNELPLLLLIAADPEVNDGLFEKLNSFSLIVHLYWVS